jgi:hypothetical protein
MVYQDKLSSFQGTLLAQGHLVSHLLIHFEQFSGITAEVFVVRNFDELKNNSAKAQVQILYSIKLNR